MALLNVCVKDVALALFGLRRVCASRHPEIPPEDLIPLPRQTVLCRQPCYRDEANPDKETRSDKPMSPQIEVHPQRDRLVEILMQREAFIQAEARQAKAKPKTVPTKTETMEGSTARAALRPMPPVQPDPSIMRPPWTFLQPLVASA